MLCAPLAAWLGGLRGAVGLVSRLLRGRHIGLQLADLRLEVRDFRLEGLKIRTAYKPSYDCQRQPPSKRSRSSYTSPYG